MLLRALVWGHLRANRLRAISTLVAIALGVALVLAIDLANATAIASFAADVDVVASRVDLQVVGLAPGFDERTLLRVERVPGVVSAQPIVEGTLTVGAGPNAPLSGTVLQAVGVDVLEPLPGDARDRTGGSAAPDLWTLIDDRGALVSAPLAHRFGWRVGATFAALAGDRAVRLRIAGILPAGLAVDSDVVFLDIATAQAVFGKVGRLDRIDCVVAPARLAATAAAVREVIPPGTRAIEPHVRTSEIGRMLGSFQLNLAALSYVALLVGMYLIYNTIAISVVQRRPEIGTLRAIGATRRQLFATFVAEGALFGAVGSLLGVALGAWFATFAVTAVVRTVSTIYASTHADRVVYQPQALLFAFGLGLAASVAAAVVPAWDAASTPPATSMREQGYERARPGWFGRTAAVGLGLIGLGGALALLPALDGVPVFGYLAGLLFIFGGSLCAPLCLRALASLGIALARDRSVSGTLGSANLIATPARTSVAVAALTIAVAMTVSIAILIGSFRTTVVAWAGDTLRADLFVRPAGGGDDATFGAATAERGPAALRRLPAVAAVDTFRGVTIPFRGRLTTLGATDLGGADVHALRFLGRVDRASLVRLRGSTNVLVSEPFATKFGLGRGDAFVLDTPSGRVRLRVAAVYNDYSSDAGVVLIDRRTYERLYRDRTIDSIAVYARPHADLERLRNAVVRALAPAHVDVQTNRELRALVVAIFDRTFAITDALYVISIAIAVLGVVTTLFALVIERRREIGILRTLGLRARDVQRMVYVEAGCIGLLGGLLGVAVGVLLSLLLIDVINRQAFGWLIELHLPWAFLAEAIVLVVLTAVAAGVPPARVAARIATADAVRSE